MLYVWPEGAWVYCSSLCFGSESRGRGLKLHLSLSLPKEYEEYIFVN